MNRGGTQENAEQRRKPGTVRWVPFVVGPGSVQGKALSKIPFVVSLSKIPFVVSLSNHAFHLEAGLQ